MKVLLHSRTTDLYYVGVDQWAADPKQARDFGDIEAAIRVNRGEKLADMEAILAYDEPLCNLVLPLATFFSL
jgi:hypothetical protein